YLLLHVHREESTEIPTTHYSSWYLVASDPCRSVQLSNRCHHGRLSALCRVSSLHLSPSKSSKPCSTVRKSKVPSCTKVRLPWLTTVCQVAGHISQRYRGRRGCLWLHRGLSATN